MYIYQQIQKTGVYKNTCDWSFLQNPFLPPEFKSLVSTEEMKSEGNFLGGSRGGGGLYNGV